MKKKTWKYSLLALVTVLIDQAAKLWVHFNMEMGYHGAIKLIGNWFKLHYTLNPGMAFGLQLGFRYGKLLLTWGRIVATFIIGRYSWRLLRKEPRPDGQLWGWALILGGAVGNVIDSTFYAVLLDNAPHNAPLSWFHGQVIDMFYLDIWETKVPAWIPFVGGSYLSFFPIFNLADVAIFLGVLTILWARRSMLKRPQERQAPPNTLQPPASTSQAEQPTIPSEPVENP